MANWLTKGPRQFGEGNDSQQTMSHGKLDSHMKRNGLRTIPHIVSKN